MGAVLFSSVLLEDDRQARVARPQQVCEGTGFGLSFGEEFSDWLRVFQGPDLDRARPTDPQCLHPPGDAGLPRQAGPGPPAVQ